MILYTTLPEELIFAELENKRQFREVEIGGVKLLVESTSDGGGQIVQVLSTNPGDFLNPDFQPGQPVKFYSCVTVD